MTDYFVFIDGDRIASHLDAAGARRLAEEEHTRDLSAYVTVVDRGDTVASTPGMGEIDEVFLSDLRNLR